MARLTKINPPALPLAGSEYDRGYLNQFGSVLRLFFNSLISFCNTLAGDTGGGSISYPYGAFASTINNVVALANTPTRVSFNYKEAANGIYAVPGDGLHIQYAGIYNVQFSIQFENADTAIHEATVWLRQNGVDLPRSATEIAVASKHGSVNGYGVLAANFFITATATDYIEMWWATDSTQLIMEAYTASTSPFVRPAVPSVVVTITFVSAI